MKITILEFGRLFDILTKKAEQESFKLGQGDWRGPDPLEVTKRDLRFFEMGLRGQCPEEWKQEYKKLLEAKPWIKNRDY
jgi:hypothetical protein